MIFKTFSSLDESKKIIDDLQEKLFLTEASQKKLLEKLSGLSDPRLIYFDSAMPGSKASSQNGSLSSSVGLGGEGQVVDKMKESKAAVREMYRTADIENQFRCLFCGTIAIESKKLPISMAHIVSSGRESYSHFGKLMMYPDEMDPLSCRNLIPLCGTKGSFRDGKRTCHNLYDAYLAVLIYNPLESTYNVHCVSDKPENILAVQKTFMPIPAGCIPYHRLLTWRAKKSLSEFNNAEIYPNADKYSDILNKTVESLEVKVQLNEGIVTGPFGSCLLSSISDRNESVDIKTDGG